MGTTLFDLDDGSTFAASERHVPETPPFGSFGEGAEAEGKLTAWVAEKWNMLFQLKRGEQERLKTCELYYSGFHYEDAWDNRNNPITNYCFSQVETVWPILTQALPRPEPVPRRYMDEDRVKRLADFAVYKMDSTGFDRRYRVAIRDLLKYGWCATMIGWDKKGRSIPRYLSPFDFYPDQAQEESDMEIFAIAFPVATRRLRAAYPKVASRIMPDNIASPSYEVLVQPYMNHPGTLGAFGGPQFIGGTMKSIATEDGAAATTTSAYAIDTGSFHVFGQTTFLIQMFVRDYTTMNVRYTGDRYIENDAGTIQIPHSMNREEPCCPSGWRMIPMTAGGILCDLPKPVDYCIGGIPLVLGRNYEHGGRMFCKGENDEVIPIQRAVNRSDALIDRALELQGNPPVTVTDGSGINVDKSSVEGGEILRIRRGSAIQFLQPQGVAESHFERRAMRRQDIQIVGGTPDALSGQRPVGIEAAAAIRQLTESASSRARAKGPSTNEWAALLLQKMIHADLKKSQEIIYFRSKDGIDMWLDPDEYDTDDFEIRWASQSGTAQGQQDRLDKNLQFFQMGLIDAQQVLEDEDYPNRAQILQRIAIQQLQAQAAAAQAGGGNGNGRKR